MYRDDQEHLKVVIAGERERAQDRLAGGRLKEVTQSQRINICYQYSVLNMSIQKIANEIGLNYSTIRTICQIHRDNSGRYNRILNFMTKKAMLSRKN